MRNPRDRNVGSLARWTQCLALFECCSGKVAPHHSVWVLFPMRTEYAKLAMAPLWAEIMENISPTLNGNSAEEMSTRTLPPKLALFSGHDTTLIPLLASLGPKLWNDKDWPPYASMMIIEVSETSSVQGEENEGWQFVADKSEMYFVDLRFDRHVDCFVFLIH